MSTMVLNRKPSLFSGPGRPGALDSQAGSKDSIDTQDITVMDTKLKILEILQVDAVEDGNSFMLSVLAISKTPLKKWFCAVHPQCTPGLSDFFPALCLQEGVCGCLSYG